MSQPVIEPGPPRWDASTVLFEQEIIEISTLGRGKNGGFVSASRYVAKFGFRFVQESVASQHRWFDLYL
jgi:hypothetical protein